MTLALGFPFQIGVNGGVKATTLLEEQVASEIVIAATTNARERVMRPDFGGNLRGALFQPNSSTLHRELQTNLRRAIGRSVSAAEIEFVDVSGDDNVVVIDIAFRLREEIDGNIYRVSVTTNGDVTEVS